MTENLLKNLDEQRKRALNAAREIAERAAAGEERAEDEAAYVKANADYDRLSGMLHDERKRMEAEKADAAAFDAAVRKAGNREAAPEARTWINDVRDALNAKETRKGYATLRIEDGDVRETRAGDGVTNLTTGANTLDDTLSHSLFRKLFDDVSILGAGVQIMRTADGNSFKIPRLLSRGILSNETTYNSTSQGEAHVAEGGTILATGEPTFDQVEFNAYKYGQMMLVTREVIQDSVIDVNGLLGELLGTNMANYLAYDLLLGSGTNMPKGVHTVIPVGNLVTGAAAKAGKIETVDQLMDIQWELKPAYRKAGKWIMNDATVLTLRKMKIADEANHYVFQPGDGAGKPDTVLGKELITDPFVPVQAVDAVSIIYGDMSKYYVRMVADLRVEWSTEYAWETDRIAVKGVLRADGDTIDDTAFAGFKGGAVS